MTDGRPIASTHPGGKMRWAQHNMEMLSVSQDVLLIGYPG